jgi:diacylglycerol kinase (ATP)
MKTRVIFNPNSGLNRRRPDMASRLVKRMRVIGLAADVAVTTGPGHATELAREAVAAGAETVVAVGGDGTMNEVAQALIGTPTALALVPCGSGNGLALHLGLPRALDAALALAAGRGRIATIDTGVVDGRPFINAMGLGLDAEVSHRFNRLTRRGLSAYVRTALAAWRGLRTERCRIETATGSFETEAVLVAVANSDQYGNNARIAPGARIDDGQLDLVAIRPVGLLGAGVLAVRLFGGTLLASGRVKHVRATSFTLRREAAGLIHTDGETHLAGSELRIAVRPRSLRLWVPHPSADELALPAVTNLRAS